jgi:hypothetical protein
VKIVFELSVVNLVLQTDELGAVNWMKRRVGG